MATDGRAYVAGVMALAEALPVARKHVAGTMVLAARTAPIEGGIHVGGVMALAAPSLPVNGSVYVAGSMVLGGLTIDVPPTFRAGGVYPRAITEGTSGVWLLEIDLGGEIIRVATRETVIESREIGDEVLFYTGLDDLSSPLSVDSVSLRVQAGSRETWAQYRNHFGPVRGRSCRLRRWFAGQVLEDAYLIIDGVVASASWGAPGAPDLLDIKIERDVRSKSVPHPPANAVVDETAWPQNVGKYIGDNIRLSQYPTVIGTPGDSGNGGATAPPFLGSPGLYVFDANIGDYIVIAGHHVAAQGVRLWNTTQNDNTGATALPVTNGFDSRNNPVAYVDVRGNWQGGTSIEPEDEVFVGWGRDPTAWGPGLTHRGQPVLGLGDLLIWGADQLSTARWDFAQMHAQREALNLYRIDTYWNESMLWEDWVQANIIKQFPVVEVQGPRGRYYRRIETETNPRNIQGRIATFRSGSGRRVERIAAVTEVGGDIVNTLEIDYGARPTSGTARRKLNIGPTKGPVPGPPGGAQITVNAANFLATTSNTFYGPRYRYENIPITWDPVTASLIGRYILSTQALPGRRTRYRGGNDLLDFYEYATIEIYDTSFGANFDGVLGIIEGITITPNGADLDVFVPDDPIAGNLT